MLRTALLTALVAIAALPAAAGAATATVDGPTLNVQLTAPGDAEVTLLESPCRRRVHDPAARGGSRFVVDQQGCAQVVAPDAIALGAGCAHELRGFDPDPTRAICTVGGVTGLVLRGSAGPDRLAVGGDTNGGAAFRTVRLEGGPGDDGLGVGLPARPGATAAEHVLDGGEGNDELSARPELPATLICGPGADTTRNSEWHDVGVDCETFTGQRRNDRPASLPGRAAVQPDGTVVLDASRYAATKLLELHVDWETHRGRTGWMVYELAKTAHRLQTGRRGKIAMANGPGCEAYDSEHNEAHMIFCPAGAATPVLVRGPQHRGLVLRVASAATAPVTAPIRVEGGAAEDWVEVWGSPFRVQASCGAGIDTVVAGAGRDVRPAFGRGAFADGDCEHSHGVAGRGRPQLGTVAARAKGVVGNRGMFPLTGLGALVKIACTTGRRSSCGGKLDLYVAGMRCGYLGTVTYAIPKGRAEHVRVQAGQIEGELRCGSLFEPRLRLAAALRRGAATRLVAITRLAGTTRRTRITAAP